MANRIRTDRVGAIRKEDERMNEKDALHQQLLAMSKLETSVAALGDLLEKSREHHQRLDRELDEFRRRLDRVEALPYRKEVRQ